MLVALKELEEKDGLNFNVAYVRRPFFLRPDEQAIKDWLGGRGMTRDATRGEVIGTRLDELFRQAGLDCTGAEKNPFGVLTMDSHRLAWHAAEKSEQQGERFWKATSRRYFEGKDTEFKGQANRLDNHAMLLECAAEAGLDEQEARHVLESDLHKRDIVESVRIVQQVGIHAIPVLIFEVESFLQNSWLDDARTSWPDEDDPDSRTKRSRAVSESPFREIHHGSGNKAEFMGIFNRLHRICLSKV